MARTIALTVAAILIATAAAPADELVAIRNVRVITVSGAVLESGTILLRGERIDAVGVGIDVPAEARIVDARGLTACPGFFDTGNQLGLVEVSDVPATNDAQEAADPLTPHVRAADAFNTDSELLPVARAAGVLVGLTVPGPSNVISGQSALVRLAGDSFDDMALKPAAALHVNLGEPPKRTFGSRGRSPMTRMGVAALLRQALVDGREYARRRAAGNAVSQPRLEPIADALEKKIPVVIRAHRRDDILTALRFADEFGFRLILLGGAEADSVADLLSRRQVPVILAAPSLQPSTMETAGANYESAARLSRARVLLAFHSEETTLVRQMVPNLGLYVAYGLPPEEALKALTIYPARIFEVADRLGSLEAGKEATFFLSRGDPLQARSTVVALFVRGQEYEPRSYQTRLCEEFIASKDPSIPCLPPFAGRPVSQ